MLRSLVGSEMCIRDSWYRVRRKKEQAVLLKLKLQIVMTELKACLTSLICPSCYSCYFLEKLSPTMMTSRNSAVYTGGTVFLRLYIIVGHFSTQYISGLDWFSRSDDRKFRRNYYSCFRCASHCRRVSDVTDIGTLSLHSHCSTLTWFGSAVSRCCSAFIR